MAPEVLAAIITGASATTAAGASAAASGSINKKTRDFNREEAAKQRDWSEQMAIQQNQWNLDLWNKENEYNNPSAQVQRLRDAGLNPLYYGLDGNSSASAFEAAQPLSYERASLQNMINPVSAGLDAAARVAQIGNIQADTSKKLNENLTETQRRENMTAELDNLRQELQNKLSQQGLTDAQKQSVLKSLDWIDRLNEANVAYVDSQTKLNESQRNRIERLVEGEALLQAKSIEDFNFRWRKISAEIDKMSKETGLLKKDIENYAINHANNGFLGTNLSIANLLRLFIGLSDSEIEETIENTTPPPTYPGP